MGCYSRYDFNGPFAAKADTLDTTASTTFLSCKFADPSLVIYLESCEGKWNMLLDWIFHFGLNDDIKIFKSGCLHKIDPWDPILLISEPRVEMRPKSLKIKPTIIPTQNQRFGSTVTVSFSIWCTEQQMFIDVNYKLFLTSINYKPAQIILNHIKNHSNHPHNPEIIHSNHGER